MLELATLVERNGRYRPEHTGFVFEGERHTWRQFAARIARVGNALRGLGVGKGDRVVTLLANCREQMEVYWACPTIGAVLVPLSPMLQPAGIAALAKDARASCIVTSPDLLNAVRPALEEIGLPAQRVLVTGTAPDGWGDFVALTGAAAETIEPAACAEGDLYNIMYTSGTTGLPKGIVHTHFIRAMYATLFASAFRVTPESVVVHTGGIVFNGAFVTLMPAFWLGATYVLARRFDAEAAIDLIERERATHIVLVPAQLVALLDAPGFAPERLASLQCILSLGAPLLQEAKDRLNALLPGRFYELYGLTEGIITILDKTEAVRKSGSVGVPVAFGAIRVVREDGTDCAPGEIGEIIGHSSMLMPGYYGRPDLTAHALRDGWLHSGDMGRLDEEGYLYLVDRKKDMIDSGGVKVYPRDIEEVAARHPAVLEVAVFGAPHDKWGETPVAAVVLRKPGAIDAEALREWINTHVAARYQRVSAVAIMDSFPRNAAGKTLKRELREPYWRDAGRKI